MIITQELFNRGLSIKNNLSDEQIRCFGVERYGNQGWINEIIDKDFPVEVYEKFIELKNKHVKRSVKVNK